MISDSTGFMKFQVGDFCVDGALNLVSGPFGAQRLEPKIIDVLMVLAMRAGEVVTRETLIDEVWGVGHGGDERLTRAIYLLRKTFRDSAGAPKFIATVPKRGYRLVAAVERLSDASPVSACRDAGPVEDDAAHKSTVGRIAGFVKDAVSRISKWAA